MQGFFWPFDVLQAYCCILSGIPDSISSPRGTCHAEGPPFLEEGDTGCKMSRGEVQKKMCRSHGALWAWGALGCQQSPTQMLLRADSTFSVSASKWSQGVCPSAAKLWSLLSLQVKDKQMQWLRNSEHDTHGLAATFFLTHLHKSSFRCGLVRVRDEGEFWQEIARMRWWDR